jgi:chromosome segregation ATPase
MDKDSFKDTQRVLNAREFLRILNDEIETNSIILAKIKRDQVETEKSNQERLAFVKSEEDRIELEKAILKEERESVSILATNLVKKDKELKEKELQIQKKESESLSRISDAENKHTSLIADKTKQLKDVEDRIKSAERSYNDLQFVKQAEIDNLSSSIKSLNLEHSVASQAYAKLLHDIEIATNELKAVYAEITEAEKRNKKEAVKIAEANNSLKVREQDIQRRERDYLILKMRLSKLLEKLYPGQNIDNILK